MSLHWARDMSGKCTDPTSAMTVSENCSANFMAAIAQLGERQTEDLKVPRSIPGLGTPLLL